MLHDWLPSFAAATAAPEGVQRWFNFPLIRLGEETVTVLTIVKILLWIVGIVVANVVFQRVVLRRVSRHTRLAVGLQFAIAKIFGYVVVVLGLYVALVVNGVNLSSLAVLAWALGLGIGFGLQSIVANFVAGLVLLTERPVAVGDRIEVAGVAGRVTKISLRATTVVTNDNISIIVPNSELTSNPVTNWSHTGPLVRMRLPVVAYGSHPAAVKEPAPSVSFDGFGDSALLFELGVWTEKMTLTPRRFRSDLYFMVERALRENGIEIPFPQRVVHVRPGASAESGEQDGEEKVGETKKGER